MNLKQVFYYFSWCLKVFISKRKIPINGGIIINDRCNLRCLHCTVSNFRHKDASFQEINTNLDKLYTQGVRSLFIVGGEPFLWRDKDYDLDSIVELAKKKGFFKVSVCTNGTFPLETKADLLWVSIDGLKATHNKIRGKTYDQIVLNIEKSTHKKILINFTVNIMNYHDVEKLIKWAKQNQKIKGVLVNFHTPFPGVERLSLPTNDKKRIIDNVLRLKDLGYPILNSKSGLLALRENNWKRPTWLCKLIDQDKIYECCCRESILRQDTCNNCGLAVAAESSLVSEGKFPSILASLRYL